MKRLFRAGVVLSAVGIFVACGGGGGNGGTGGGSGGGSAGGAGGGTAGGAGGGAQGNCNPACFNNQKCHPVSNTCVNCIDNFDCSGATPVCNQTTFTCEANGGGGGSGGGTGGGSGGGGGTSAAGDTCSNANSWSLATIGATQTATIDLTGFTPNENGSASCGPASSDATLNGNDVVYTINVTATGADLNLALDVPSTTTRDPLMIVRTGACTPGTEVACGDVGYSGDSESLKIKGATGTYYVIIKEWKDSSATGNFTFTANLTATPPAPANDLCTAATAWTLSAGQTQTATFDPSGANAEENSANCGPTSTSTYNGGDVAFAITVNGTGNDLEITAAPDTGSTQDPVIIVRTGACSPGTEVNCTDDGFDGDSEKAVVRGASGLYYVIVKSWSGPGTFSGTVTVTAQLKAPTAADYCGVSGSVSLTSNTKQSFSVDSNNFTDDYQGTCGGFGNEAVYAVTVPANRDVDVVSRAVALTDGGAGANPILHARAGDCDGGAEAACTTNSGPAELMTIHNTDGGTYFVFVDTSSGTNGTMNVSFESLATAAIPANDTCTATSAPLVDHNSTQNGTLNGANDDFVRDGTDGGYYGCVGGAAPDVFFRVIPDAGTTLTATVTPTAGTLQPAVLILSSCTLSSGVKVCQAAAAANTAAVASTSVTPGTTYYIAVEGKNASRGSFNLTLLTQ